MSKDALKVLPSNCFRNLGAPDCSNKETAHGKRPDKHYNKYHGGSHQKLTDVIYDN